MKFNTQKMKADTILSRKWFVGNVVVIVLGIFAITCVFINEVEYAPSVDAGQIAEFKLTVFLDVAEARNDARLVVGFLAPRSWNAAQNITATYTDSEESGVQTMSIIPAGTSPSQAPGQSWPAAIRGRVGIGENVLDDMEWITFWTDKTYSVNNGQDIYVYVTIRAKAGPENLKFKPTFFVNETADGMTTNQDFYKVYKGDCFAVTNGTGDVIDFCELHFNSVQPLTATEDDFITIGFQGDVDTNDLVEAGVDKIFLSSTAYVRGSGRQIEVRDNTAAQQMKKQFQYGNSYAITVWPARYYNLAEGEELERIEYSFTNEDGSIEVVDEAVGTDFVYTFKCQ
ncbi:DUF4961 domain-containing protein [Dawidia soli]|uniref:DUF4961 domain-containing protein n=1 Tax=Dawidia soli TaxID=2782352 RepID=A0AAP2D7S2_9BACT|nr:DUF4961 domain-containing protein [Dawidia soli]MBT1685590.1 DUF4961 domain-containing protein [Dawidia soli]